MANESDDRPLHQRLHEEGIQSNAEKIARIFLDGDVAVLFFEVGRGPKEMQAGAEAGARALGWTGKRTEVTRMNKTRAAKLADVIAATTPGDTAAVEWLRRRSGNRLLVLAHVGTLCVDHVEGAGFSIVEGTGDREWMS